MANLSPLTGLLEAKRTAHRADIDSGILTGINPDSIVVYQSPRTADFLIDNAPKKLPCILLCPAQQAERIKAFGQGGGQAYDEIGYPIMVMLIDRHDSTDPDCRMDWRNNFRDAVMDRHREQRNTLTDPVAIFDYCEVAPGPPVDYQRMQSRGVWASWFTATYYTLRAVPA